MATLKYYPSLRTGLTAEQVHQFKRWCLDNHTTMARELTLFVIKRIKSAKTNSTVRVAEMNESDNNSE